jgi:hypothetical protein
MRIKIHITAHWWQQWVPNMFCGFYSVKNPKIVNNLTTTKAKEKISTKLESSECSKNFDVGLAKFENNQI